ncbi:NAD(P)H-hydrate dehydratase [Primorskyibacter flagellatus]|uniref:NAD(P)H-hydrate dehydratase n=1 Tax=Primorskyibacter flagellatus TaxID=1387277 RepID=UPI003A921613
MTELLTAAQMRAIEQAAIDSGEVSGLELMERAGRGVVEAIFEEWPEFARDAMPERGPAPAPREYLVQEEETSILRAVVLCGPGNNGGDGFVVARLLQEQGWKVQVFLHGDPSQLPPDAKVNYERWCALGTTYSFLQYEEKFWNCDLLVDALFGTGLKRALREFDGLFSKMENMVGCRPIKVGHEIGRAAIVAIDLPTGICADSGRIFAISDSRHGVSASAHLTVTFHSMKLGHVLADGPDHCGKVVVKTLGIEAFAFRWSREGPDRQREVWLEQVTLAKDSICLGKEDYQHKYSHGHALILSGGAGRTGAARLAARGALRIGAGLVTLGVPGSAQMEVACQITAMMLKRVEDGDGLASALEDGRINALCLGPGLGLDERATGLVAAALRAPAPEPGPSVSQGPGPSPGRAVLLDADALSLLARDPDLFALLHDQCVLTPHAGEFKRLFPDIAEKLNAAATKGPAYSKVDATRAVAKRAGCVVLFKGAETVIADPSGACTINLAKYDRAAPWLATAGSGDVLAGFIAGLLARGYCPMDAAASAAWLHVECARSFGPGLIAEDLPEVLPQVLSRVLGS